MADQAGAYWLIDEIALAQRYESKVRAVCGSTATLVCEDGNDQRVFAKDISFTDFPEPGITLWCTDNVILLPSEY